MYIKGVEQFISKLKTNELNRKQKIIGILSDGQSVRKSVAREDDFIKQLYCKPITYEKFSKSNTVSDRILDAINNHMNEVIGTRVPGEEWSYDYNGLFFTAKEIPAINCDELNEIKSDNNVIDFGKNRYFKYVSDDGQAHVLYTDDKVVNSVLSEHLRGAPYDEKLQKYAAFWRHMMSDCTYLNLWYSDEEVRGYMKNANIDVGFFSVKMSDSEQTQFYSATTKQCCIQSKEKYDVRYHAMTSLGELLKNYEPGDQFKIGGKQYTLSKNHTLDIPYGEDIYDIEYPSNYKFGKKII